MSTYKTFEELKELAGKEPVKERRLNFRSKDTMLVVEMLLAKTFTWIEIANWFSIHAQIVENNKVWESQYLRYKEANKEG